MKPTDPPLRFAVKDRINDREISPSYVPLSLMSEFPKDVAQFLKGSNGDVNPNDIMVSIEPGSLMLAATVLMSAGLCADLERLQSSSGSLNLIDPKRAKIIEHWQALAKKNPHRRYDVGNQATNPFFSINATSDFRKTDDMWVHVEKYVHGKVVDIGGKTKANVHLEIEGGVTLTIAATQTKLAQGEQNRLYRPALLHVIAEENLMTGELRNYELLAFSDYQPRYDDDEFKLMVERGTKAWADVQDATSWLENLRGYQA
ncbi:MAG: hypothetical protein PHU14_01145 [Methylovulum sp.]|nr:hypothetical protein [Methylovulum sp.]